jgi:hypothetical protein
MIGTSNRDPLDVETERLKAKMAQIRQFSGSALPNAATQLALMYPLDPIKAAAPKHRAAGNARVVMPRSAPLRSDIVSFINRVEAARAVSHRSSSHLR